MVNRYCGLSAYIQIVTFGPHFSIPIIVAYFLFFRYTRHTLTPGPLPLLFRLSTVLSPDICLAYFLSFFRSLCKCHLREIFPDHPICNCNLNLPISCLPFLLSFLLSSYHCLFDSLFPFSIQNVSSMKVGILSTYLATEEIHYT